MKWNHILMLCGTLIAAGCGSDTGGRTTVSGRVTFDGDPLPAGRILFTPAEENPGPSAGGVIEEGRYRIRAEEGPIPGPHTITVTTGVMPQKGAGMGAVSAGQTPPMQQNRRFHFSRTIGDGDGNHELDFDLVPQESDTPR